MKCFLHYILYHIIVVVFSESSAIESDNMMSSDETASIIGIDLGMFFLKCHIDEH